jgi:phospholipid transport system substrate-binding protein
MNLRHLKIAVLSALVSVAYLPAAESAADCNQMLKGAVDEVLAIAYNTSTDARPLSQRVRPALEKYFNFESITRKAIGPGWRQFKPEQQAAAVTLFTEVVIRNYADRFEVGERPGITYISSIAPDPKRPTLRELPTTIDYAGKKYSVMYRLEKTGDTWRIFDVVIEGISMIANWRAQLDPLYQHGGASEVLAALIKTLATPPPLQSPPPPNERSL